MVDPTSMVSPEASLSAGVEIGPFCRIGPHVSLGERVRLVSHVVIDGHTHVGSGTVVYPFTMLGGPPQHTAYAGEPTTLSIGADCDIREGVSIQRGTAAGGGATVVGDRAFVMAHAHIAHDCLIGDGVTFAGNCTLGGHVQVGDGAVIGGVTGIHQFCRIGERAMIGGASGVRMDVIPFGIASGSHARLQGLNVVGLKRAGVKRDAIKTLRAAFRELFVDDGPPFRDRLAPVAERYADAPEVMKIIDFLRSDAHRPVAPYLAAG